MLSTRLLCRGMARHTSSKNLNPNGTITVYQSEEWEPPVRPAFTTQTPEKRIMRWPVDFRHPRTPGRVSLADRDRVMRMHDYGCTNRRVLHIVIAKERLWRDKKLGPKYVIETLGTYDPHVNAYGEKLVSLNIERILYYISQGVKIEQSVLSLLGLAGLLPQEPTVYVGAYRNRRELTRGLKPQDFTDSDSSSSSSDSSSDEEEEANMK